MGKKEILENELLVKEPIDEINRKIDETKEHVVVLNGGRGCGKTSVLLSREENNIESNDLSVYQIFESYDKGFNDIKLEQQFGEWYYELQFSQYLLSYIKNNKPDSFHKYEKLYCEINNRRIGLLQFILNYGYDENKFSEFDVKKSNYTLKVIDCLKETFDKDRITLMIDRFDWMDNRSKASQEYISKYFDMFDKVILTTDDESYASSYPTITIDYGKKIDGVVNILKKYVISNNSAKELQNEMFDPINVNAKTIEYLFNRAEGNLTVMKHVISKLSYYGYDKTIFTEEDLIEQYRLFTDREIALSEETTGFSRNIKPKFHI